MAEQMIVPRPDRYRWVTLTNTTMAVFMSSLDGSIILIALPAIFNGIHLNPLAPSNIAYLLWMIMGYRLVRAIFVVNLGRLGDILGRVRMDNAGFVVFTVASMADAFRETDLPVVLVNVTGRAPGRTNAGGGNHTGALPDGWADIIEELHPRPGDHRITKKRRSAFHDTGLDTLLRDLGVTQVILAGVSTSSGVESTARSAHDYGYNVVLAADAMDDHDDASNRHSLDRVFPKLGETASNADIINRLRTNGS